MPFAKTERVPQVGSSISKQALVNIPFQSISFIGPLNKAHGKDNRDAAFWKGALVANVHGRKHVARVYDEAAGGETVFKHDLDRLLKNKGPYIPQVYAYSTNTTTPCILFHTSRVVSVHAYMGELIDSSPGTALQDSWQLLLDIRDAAKSLMNDFPLLQASIVCDALAKASVDDRGVVILTPEIDGNPFDCPESAERLVETAWAGFFRTGRYPPLRPLGYALAGDLHSVMGRSPREFKDAASAIEHLQKYWVKPSRRYLRWPRDVKGYFEPGDVGVFEKTAGTERVFKKLTSATSELGGIVIDVRGADFKEVKPGIHRVTHRPQSNTENSQFLLDFVSITWSNDLKAREEEWNWLRANAPTIAAKHSVNPEDLVLLTTTNHGLKARGLKELVKTLKRPIHLYVHIDPSGYASQYYWSLSDSPHLRHNRETQELNQDTGGLVLPPLCLYPDRQPHPSRYLQLERADLN